MYIPFYERADAEAVERRGMEKGLKEGLEKNLLARGILSRRAPVAPGENSRVDKLTSCSIEIEFPPSFGHFPLRGRLQNRAEKTRVTRFLQAGLKAR
jgi:hypothetical protein